jgi:hypothetical protein
VSTSPCVSFALILLPHQSQNLLVEKDSSFTVVMIEYERDEKQRDGRLMTRSNTPVDNLPDHLCETARKWSSAW